MRRPLVMGNWKLNGNKNRVQELTTSLCNQLRQFEECTIAIAPPTLYLERASQLLNKSNIVLGAQNTDLNLVGAYTGEISPMMLKDIGVELVIIGHSERRMYHNETDAIVAKKFKLLQESELTPVLCIGETEQENETGLTALVCAKQLDAVLNLLGIDAFKQAIIAYEPIWAIGTGKSATPQQAQKIHAFIRAHLAKHQPTIAENITILYGGSVTEENAMELFMQPDIDGALVGGASLKADVFTEIVKAANTAKLTSKIR